MNLKNNALKSLKKVLNFDILALKLLLLRFTFHVKIYIFLTIIIFDQMR